MFSLHLIRRKNKFLSTNFSVNLTVTSFIKIHEVFWEMKREDGDSLSA